jgi:hypothetical protein
VWTICISYPVSVDAMPDNGNTNSPSREKKKISQKNKNNHPKNFFASFNFIIIILQIEKYLFLLSYLKKNIYMR